MATGNIKLPSFGTGSFRGEPTQKQIASYLRQLTEQIEYAFHNLDASNFSADGQKLFEQTETAAKAVSELTQEQSQKFDQIRNEIINTATEIRNDYQSKISQSEQNIRTEVSEEYVARSEGDAEGTVSELKEYIGSAVDQSAQEIRFEFSSTQEIAQAASDGLSEYKREVSTYLKFYEDGLEIGKSEADQTLPYSVRISNEKMSFLQNGVEVAYIKYNKLYITVVEVLDRFTIGSASMGGYFDFETSELGMGILWRDIV